MTNGDEIPKTVTRTVKRRSEFPMWVWGLLAVMLIAGLAIYAGVTFGQPATPQVAISGGGSPAGPAGPAPTLQPSKVVNFEQLTKALNTPEKIQEFMVNYPFELAEHSGVSYEPQELLQHGGKGRNDEFAHFFAMALMKQGCQWEPRLYFFDVFNEKNAAGHRVQDVVLIAFYDARDGNNKYFVADPEIKFPIYPMGKATNPIPLEEARRGVVHDSRAGMGEDYCKSGRV